MATDSSSSYASAVLSECRTWRYALTREWGAGDTLNIIGLNPSTADESRDDPTIRRCVGYAQRWAFGRLVMTNLFAFRSTDPEALKAADDPVGPENDTYLVSEAQKAGYVLCAWGAHGGLRSRSWTVKRLLRGLPLYVFGFTADGEPLHPLYLRRDREPSPWIVV